MTARSLLILLALAILSAGLARMRGPVQDEMAAAALRFLDSLPPDLRARAGLPFDGPQREDWHFVPRSRPGVMLREMEEDAQAWARRLLRASLSHAGAATAAEIMSLDAILRDMEKAAGGDGASRDPLAYSFAVFGTPPAPGAWSGPWGWKVEGHHLSVNFTWATRDDGAATPMFMGANPANVAEGRWSGLRVLSAEEDQALAFLRSLDDAQRARAVIAAEAPREIITLPGRSLDLGEPVGLPGSEMTDLQRLMLGSLIGVYAERHRPEQAREEKERIEAAGLRNVWFAWAGGTKPGEGQYYRIAGPTFIIEYDNTQDRANHIHTVWHDRTRDFGRDLLKEHYEHDHTHE